MDLEKIFEPSTTTFHSTYSDKRTAKSEVSGTIVLEHEGDFIKSTTKFNFEEGSLYPRTQINLIPKSIIKERVARWVKGDDPYGAIAMDMVVVEDRIITNIHSIDGKLIGASVREQNSNYGFRQVGFLYNAPDDLLRWELIAKTDINQ